MGATGAFVFCDAGLTGSPLGMALITTTGLSGVGLVVASTLPLVSTEVAGAPSKMWRANRSIRVWLIPTCSVHSRSISRACATADGSFQRVTLNRPSASGTAANFTPKLSSVVTNPATSKSAIPPSTKKVVPAGPFLPCGRLQKPLPLGHIPRFSCFVCLIGHGSPIPALPPDWVRFAKMDRIVHVMFSLAEQRHVSLSQR